MAMVMMILIVTLLGSCMTSFAMFMNNPYKARLVPSCSAKSLGCVREDGQHSNYATDDCADGSLARLSLFQCYGCFWTMNRPPCGVVLEQDS